MSQGEGGSEEGGVSAERGVPEDGGSHLDAQRRAPAGGRGGSRGGCAGGRGGAAVPPNRAPCPALPRSAPLGASLLRGRGTAEGAGGEGGRREEEEGQRKEREGKEGKKKKKKFIK